MNPKEKKTRLLNLIKERALSKGEVTLSSGKKSSYYVDCRKITLHPEGSFLIADLSLDLIDEEIDAVGGLSLGADPIAGSIAAVSFLRERPLNTFIVRKKAKGHGKKRRIEGHLSSEMEVAVVDDVATTGGSLIEAIDVLEDFGCSIKQVFVILDRLEGARGNLEKRGYRLDSIFTADDLLK